MKRPLLVTGAVFSALAALYSLLGVMMADWVAQVPGNSPGHIRLNYFVWIPASILFCGLFVLFVRMLLKERS